MGDGGVPIRAPTTGDQCLGGGGMVDVHVMCEGGGQGAGRESWGHEPGRVARGVRGHGPGRRVWGNGPGRGLPGGTARHAVTGSWAPVICV